MYSPKLDEQVTRGLYRLKQAYRIPMTKAAVSLLRIGFFTLTGSLVMTGVLSGHGSLASVGFLGGSGPLRVSGFVLINGYATSFS